MGNPEVSNTRYSKIVLEGPVPCSGSSQSDFIIIIFAKNWMYEIFVCL